MAIFLVVSVNEKWYLGFSCPRRGPGSPLARGVPAGVGVANNKMKVSDTPPGVTRHPSGQRGIFTNH